MIKKTKTSIPKHLAEEVQGFEEVFGDYIEDAKKSNMNKRYASKTPEKNELQNFLELEIDRLTSLDNFLSKKVSVMKNFSQTQKLIEMQKKRKEELTNEMIQRLKRPDSQFQKNLASLINSYFA